MNQGMRGLFAGVGNALSQTGQQGVNDFFKDQRLKLRQKLNAEAKEEDREFERQMAETQDQRERERLKLRAKLNKEGQQTNWSDVTDEQGNLIGQRNEETNEFRPLKRGEAKMDPATKYQLDRISAEVDHLWEMERRIRTGATGDFGEIGVVTDNNRDEVLKDVRRRIQANERQMNQLLENTPEQGRGRDPEALILEQAQNVPEGERGEFLTDLRNHPDASDDLVRRVQESWGEGGAQGRDGGAGTGAEGSTTGKDEQPEPRPRPERGDDSGADEPAGAGLLQQFLQGNQGGQGGTGSDIRVPLRPGADSGASGEQDNQPTESTNQGQAAGDDNRLGPAIERGLSWLADRPEAWRKERVENAVKEMERIAVEGPPENEASLRGFFATTAPYLNDAPPEIREQMIEIFGEERLKPFLERRNP